MATTGRANVTETATLSTSAKIAHESEYNVDRNGWALLESYIWDIGDDEEIERLIDKALRILLIHPEFEKFIWKNKQTLSKIYTDQSFGEVVSEIPKIIKRITQEMVVLQIENTSAFSKIKKNVNISNLKGMFKHAAGKSDLVDAAEIEMKMYDQEEKQLENLSDQELYEYDDDNELDSTELAQKYAFWNISVYKELKKCFSIKNKAQESYLWSFLLSIACCIKYLEIEINAMPQFDIKKSTKSHQDKMNVIWKGFIVPPTHGAIGVNYHPDDDDADKIRKDNTEFIPIAVERRRTKHIVNAENCAGCFVRMNETNWYKDSKPYCSQCIKFRVYQECVRKFVLEYDNEETRDDLWPWYENNKNQPDQLQYKAILDMYSDQVLTIGTILESNLKYYVPRSQTLNAAKTKSGSTKQLATESGLLGNQDIKNLLIKSRTHFQPYRNIRYLRKFAAMFLLGDREIWKDLLKLKKYLKKSRYQIKTRSERLSEQLSEQSNASGGGGGQSLGTVLQFDKSAIDDESDFKITLDDRKHIYELLEDETIQELLYGKHGMDRINEIQQRILNRPKSNGNKIGFNDALAGLFDEDTNRFKRAQSEAVNNLNECRPGVEKYLNIWSRLPHWWEPLHDKILLELASMHQLDVTKYYEALDEEEYYQEVLEDHYYKAFEFWCTKDVNVQHRLRFLLFVIDQRQYPESMIFMNDIMKYSHISSFKLLEKHNPNNNYTSDTEIENYDEKNDIFIPIKRKESKLLVDDYDERNDEKPVRNIEREFRDIVQLLEPEALGVRIWRFIMNQMAAKQRKSLWKALTILAEELPSNMILSLLEEDRELLRRGKPRYVNAVCQAVIRGSNYPTATALHLARYMDENAHKDLARTEIWRDFCHQYEEIAIYLINEVESDHLLALLLEIPTDIQQKTLIEMAVLYKRVKFINSARVQGVMTHMWSESEFLNPNKPVRTTYLAGYEFFKLLWKSPVRFYYCPMGLYATTAFLYIFYLLLVSYVTWKWVYPYSEWEFGSAETLMWVSNAGYILYELLEFESKGGQYFAMDSLINVFDTLISINWIILFILRIFAPVFTGKNYMGEPDLDDTIDRDNPEAEGSALIRTDPDKRNATYTMFYMFLWSIQIIILWIRIVGLLQRTEFMGPLLRMMLHIAKDIASFFILILAVSCGFLFAIYYIVGGDIDRDVTCNISLYPPFLDETNPIECVEASEAINSMRGISIYLTQTLLGQQDWDVLDENPLYGMSRVRAQLLTAVVLFYVLLGTILSLNMLIAIMTTSFDRMNLEAKSQLAFLRVETTYDLAHRGRIMPPPFNIFVIIVWILITLINILIKALSCGGCKLNLDGVNPYYISCLRRGNQHGFSSIIRKENEKSRTDYSASKTKKDVANQLQRLNTRTIDANQKHEKNRSAATLRFDQLSQLFEQIDSLSDDTKKKYCKHCYCRMKDIKDGKVDDYFKFFEPGYNNTNHTSFGLDKDDMRMIKRLFRYCSLCPQCFRPYSVWTKGSGKQTTSATGESIGDLGTDRYDRHHVLMDVISCYFFLLLVWIPLVILFVIPAVFSKIISNISKSEQTGYASNKQLDAGAFGDYHRTVQQQTVKSIVDKQYNGTKAFDDDYDSDDNQGDDDDKIHAIMYELMEKVDQLSKHNNTNDHTNSTKKHHLTAFQSVQKQKQKNVKKKQETAIRIKNKKQKEKQNEQNMTALIMDTTQLVKSITAEKNNVEDDNKIEEEEQEKQETKIKKVSIQESQNQYEQINNDRNDDEQP